MRRYNKGYTLVEVMIFLAVSSAIFISAVSLLSGQQEKTEFNQSMRDFNSKLQTSINDVKTGFYPSNEDTKCITSSSTDRAELSFADPNELGSNEDCLYLGKTIHLINDDEMAYIYTILGNRTVQLPATTVRVPATTFNDARPELAYFSGGPDLTEEYTIPAGAKVLSSKITEVNGTVRDNYYLVGFYSSLQETSNPSSSDGSQSILTKGYNTSDSTPRSDVIRDCINQVPSCSSVNIKRWEICVQGANDQTALITVSTSVAGITSDLEFKTCT